MNRDTYCGYCGTKFAEQKLYPRICFRCNNNTYRNPVPVVVGIIPVVSLNLEVLGILKIRRGIEPGKGGWALPGGFVDYGETWQDALFREIKEEIGIIIDPEFALKGIEKSNNNNLIIFGVTKWEEKLPEFQLNDEVLEIGLYNDPMEELVFPTHTIYARKVLHSVTQFAAGNCT